jgi:hemolysin III
MNSNQMNATGRPKLRGWFHELALFLSLGAGPMLIFSAQHNPTAYLASWVYVLSLVTQFLISSRYHRINWTPSKYRIMKRLDHSAIFILIAGTATPIALLAMPTINGIPFLKLVWAIALSGVVLSVLWVKAPKPLSAFFFLAMGWAMIPFLRHMSLDPFSTVLFRIAAVFYTLGAVIYALKRPNINPRVFGYHELFHVFTVIAATCHFIIIANLVK